MSVRTVAKAVVFSVLVLGVASATAAPFALRRGVMVDSERQTAFIAKPNGSIEAIDLGSGRTTATWSEAALPLGLTERYLVAQIESPKPSSRLHIVILDRQTPGRKVSDVWIDLPSDVQVLIDDKLDRSFRAVVEPAGGILVVSWFSKELPIRRNAMRPVVQPARRMYSGSARIVPESGQVLESEAQGVAEVPARWRNSGGAPAAPWRAGNVLATIEGGRGGPLTLERKDAQTGSPLPARVLSKAAVAAVPSADQRHLSVSEHVGDGGANDPAYRWAFFAIETAEAVGELRRDVSAAPFFLWNGDVIFESVAHGQLRGKVWVDEPLEIQSVRLSTGVLSWHVPIRDLEYRGPVPPAR